MAGAMICNDVNINGGSEDVMLMIRTIMLKVNVMIKMVEP